MLKRDIGGYWLASGQRVRLTARYFEGRTGTIAGSDWMHGGYLIRMDGTGHVLPFRECELESAET